MQTTPANGKTPLDQLSAVDRQTRLIFVLCLLEAQQNAQTLLIERAKQQKPTKSHPQGRYESPLLDALWAGYNALRLEADRCAKEARQRGQLLYCFEGTTVLEGCAA